VIQELTVGLGIYVLIVQVVDSLMKNAATVGLLHIPHEHTIHFIKMTVVGHAILGHGNNGAMESGIVTVL